MVSNVCLNSIAKRGGRLIEGWVSRRSPICFDGLRYMPVLEKDTLQLTKTVNDNPIPDYLYHLTSRYNYEHMLKDGKIHPSKDGWSIRNAEFKSIFMIDLENFMEKWKLHPFSNDVSFKLTLFEQANRCRDLVLLRIPTAKIDRNLLRIRSQNKSFNKPFREQLFCEKIGCSAKLKYKYDNEAIEYIYPHDIPINDVEFVGSSDYLQKAKKDLGISEYSDIIEEEERLPSLEIQNSIVKQILNDLFKNAPTM